MNEYWVHRRHCTHVEVRGQPQVSLLSTWFEASLFMGSCLTSFQSLLSLPYAMGILGLQKACCDYRCMLGLQNACWDCRCMLGLQNACWDCRCMLGLQMHAGITDECYYIWLYMGPGDMNSGSTFYTGHPPNTNS